MDCLFEVHVRLHLNGFIMYLILWESNVICFRVVELLDHLCMRVLGKSDQRSAVQLVDFEG